MESRQIEWESWLFEGELKVLCSDGRFGDIANGRILDIHKGITM